MKDFKTKYAPKTFADLIIHDPNNVIKPILQKYASGQINQNRIFVGDAGTGKSTLAKVLAAELYRSHGDDDIAFYVKMANEKDDVQYRPNMLVNPWRNNSKVIWHILDEVDKCNHKNLYNVLHHTLTDENGYKYLLTANSVVGIPETILSRAKPMFIDCPTPEEFFPRAKQIVQLENIVASDEKIMQMLKAGERNLRGYYKAFKYL